jgi:hypothetical protein
MFSSKSHKGWINEVCFRSSLSKLETTNGYHKSDSLEDFGPNNYEFPSYCVDKCRQLEMLTEWLKSESRIRLTELNIDRAQTRSAMNLGGVQ